MSSTFTPNKNLNLMATGDQVDLWGGVLNADVFTLIDQCLGSTVSIALSNTPVTLSTSQIQNLAIAFSGTLTADVTVTLPAVGGIFYMSNGTTGNFTVTIVSAGAGTSQVLPRGYGTIFITDGTNVHNIVEPRGQFTDIAAAATVDIGTVPNGLVNVTGTGATITSFGATARSVQSLFLVKFADVNTIVNSANLICPGNGNITTAAGDSFTVYYAGGGIYRILGGFLASGQPVVSPSQTYVPKPQTVLSGPKTAAGAPNFLPTSSATLNLTSQGLTTTPLVLTAAGGYGPTGLINNTQVISSNVIWAFTPNSVNYMGWNLTTQATFISLFKPIYQYGGSISTTAGQYTYDITASQMYVGTGSGSATANVVFIGEGTASLSSISGVIAYAFQRRYYYLDTGNLPTSTGTLVSKPCNIGTNVGVHSSLQVLLTQAVGNLPAGMLATLMTTSYNTGGIASGPIAISTDGYNVQFTLGNFGNWIIFSVAGSGAYSGIPAASGNYVLTAWADW